jgi:hypothetical protein
MNLRAGDRTPFDLTTMLGETYHNCRILKVTPAALTVAYDNGVAKVSFDLLGDAWKDLYHYDPEKARRFLDREEEKRRQAEAKLRERMRAIEDQRNEHMSELVKLDKQREALEAKVAKEQADAAAKAASTPPALAPYPGDPAVPQNPPISNIYTPNQPVTGDGYPPAYNAGSGYQGSSYPFGYTPGYVYPPTIARPRPPMRGPGFPGHHPSPPSGSRFPMH